MSTAHATSSRRPSGARARPTFAPAGSTMPPPGVPVSSVTAKAMAYQSAISRDALSGVPMPMPMPRPSPSTGTASRSHQHGKPVPTHRGSFNPSPKTTIAGAGARPGHLPIPASPGGLAYGHSYASASASASAAWSPRTATSDGSISSRDSPALSSGSDRSLQESSRVNIRGYSGDDPRASRYRSGGDWVLSPKDAYLETPREMYSPTIGGGAIVVKDAVDAQFDQLLETLQVPTSVREKFSAVSSDVKCSFLTSSSTTNPAILSALGLPLPTPKDSPKVRKRMSTPLLRKAKSSSSLGSPGPNAQEGRSYRVEGDSFMIVKSPTPMAPSSPGGGGGGGRGKSMDMPRPSTMRMSTGPPGSSTRPMSFGLWSSTSSGTLGKGSTRGLGIAMGPSNVGGGEQPETFITWLHDFKATDLRMDVGRMKKLRMLLRHESTDWVSDFIGMGGYDLVLARLQDLLDVEWREEQHDDQMLYELLRCIKALSTSEIGKASLRDQFPQPFPALSGLLFSEKKPGDLPSRQIIIELWLFLFDLFPSPSSASPIAPSGGAAGARPSSVRFDQPPHLAGIGPSRSPVNVTTTVRELLAPDQKDKYSDQHDFITQSHRPRVFKAWVGELSDICRDYFWIMCHGSNTLWNIDEVDPSLVEKPVAPGGATGGVEFEAMNYVTIHFKLLNELSRRLALEDHTAATQLHRDLFASGLDRILMTFRKASTTYYPTLHLELARYVTHLQAVSPNARLPHLIEKMVGPPPEQFRKRGNEGGWLKGLELGKDGGRRGAWDMQM